MNTGISTTTAQLTKIGSFILTFDRTPDGIDINRPTIEK